MSVIIRLQGLPWTASAMNIRHFFTGLNIPAGGVHIIGGEGGDAFIAFSSDEDARMAMKMNMSPLNGAPVQLFLSSKSEMQSVIDAARSGGSSSNAQSMPQKMPAMLGNSGNMPVPNQAGVGGGNPMGGVPSNSAMMGNQAPQMHGFQEMPGQMQTGTMGQKNNFQMMQQPRDMNMPGSGNMGNGNMRNDWQGYSGMAGQGNYRNQANMNMNQGQFQQQNMMGGSQDQFSRFGGMQQLTNNDRMFSGMGQNAGLPQGQGQSQQMMGTDQPKVAGEEGGMGQNQSQFGNAGVRPSPARSDATDKSGQFAGAEDVAANRGFPAPNNKAGSIGKEDKLPAGGDRIAMMQGGVGVNSNFPMDRFGRQQMPMDATRGSNPGMEQWGKMEEGFPNKDQFPTNAGRDQMYNPEMNKEDPFPRRDGRKRPNRFAEHTADRPDTQDSFDLNKARPDQPPRPGFLKRDARMLDQFCDDYQDSPLAGRFSEKAPGYPEGDTSGKASGGEDGLPSTRYPPDDEPPSSHSDRDRFMGGHGMMNDFRRMPDDRRFPPPDRRFLPQGNEEPQRGIQDNRRGFPEDGQAFQDVQGPRGRPDDQMFRPHVNRFDRDESGIQIEPTTRGPPHDRPPPSEGRGFLRDPTQNPPSDSFGPDADHDFPRGDRFPSDRPFFDRERGMRGREDDFLPRDGRPDDRMDMWQNDRSRQNSMGRRRPDDNPFSLDDHRYRDREDQMSQEGNERGPRGYNDMMYGPMGGMGRGGSDGFNAHQYPPEQRPGFPHERPGMPRDEERNYPPYPSDRYPEGIRENDRPGIDRRSGLLDNEPDGAGDKKPERGPLFNNQEVGEPVDMDQRFDKDMGPVGGRGRGMFREEDDYGYGPPSDGFGRGGGALPRDFDNRASGPRGRGGPFMDRGPRGRGEPFGRGRPGGPPFGRGQRRDGDRFFDEHGRMGQDVDSRNMNEPFPNAPHDREPGMPDRQPSGPVPRGLLGDGPREQRPEEDKQPEDPKNDADRREADSRLSRRGEDRDRERRSYDDRRGRDREDKDRYSYRGRYDRDRERDRDRRRSRSRSRERSSRDRDRYSKDNRDRFSRDRGSRSEPDTTKSKPPSVFLSLKNLPKTFNFRDIRRFFQPSEIPVDGIKIINDRDGNRSGDAFIYFYRIEDAVRAQKANGERIESCTLSVQFTTEEQFRNAIDSYVPNRHPHGPGNFTKPPASGSAGNIPKPPASGSAGNIPKPPASGSAGNIPKLLPSGPVENIPKPPGSGPVGNIPKPPPPAKPTNAKKADKTRYIAQLKNLPKSVTRQDISNFFKSLKIDKEGEAAYIEFDQGGNATGVGFVEFETDIDYKKALALDGTLMGAQNVKVSPGSEDEADKLKGMQREMFQRAALRSIANKTVSNQNHMPPQQPSFPKPLIPPVEKSDEDKVCVHIQGLPLLATPHDIRDFFSDCQIAARGINIAHDGAGKPMGEGFVEFKSKADVDKALKRDKTSLGRHIVAVKLIGKKDMSERLDKTKHPGGLPPKTPPQTLPSSQSDSPAGKQINTSQTQNIPLPKPLLSQSQENPVSVSQSMPQQQNSVSGQQPPHQRNPPQPPAMPTAGGNNSGQQQPNNPSQRPHPPEDMNKGAGLPALQTPLLQTPPLQGMPMVIAPGGGKSFPPGVLNNNWFYVRCQNFPPEITIGDIMQFFHPFRPIGESIRLHYSSEGTPTGNAVVGFNTADEANRAMQRFHMRMCGHKPVNIQPA